MMGIPGSRIKMGESGWEVGQHHTARELGQHHTAMERQQKLVSIISGGHIRFLGTLYSFAEAAKHLYPSVTQKTTVYLISVISETASML